MMATNENSAPVAAGGAAGSEQRSSTTQHNAAGKNVQLTWSDDELSQLRQQQRKTWLRLDRTDRGEETLPTFAVRHVAGSKWWLVVLADGDMIAMRTGTLLSNTKFSIECCHQFERLFASVAQAEWSAMLNGALHEGGPP